MILSLFTNDLQHWLTALDALAADHGRWNVAASIYSARGAAFSTRIGLRAAAWLSHAKEVIVLDIHSEVVPGSADAQAVERDLNAALERVENAAKKRQLRYLPCLLDWMPESSKGGVR